jgi:hypothetical protein
MCAIGAHPLRSAYQRASAPLFRHMRTLIALAVAVFAAAVLAAGINRIVVTDGKVSATVAAFKSDYLPLD